MMPRKTPFLVALGLAGSILAPRPARAYCLATTELPPPGATCTDEGKQLYWGSACIPFSVHEAGSRVHEIDYDELVVVVERAFETWASADCGDATPSFRAINAGPAACATPEYNARLGNAHVFMFREDVWPYEGGLDTFGRTSLQFDLDTGELLDVDVEINGTVPISFDGEIGADLESVVLHEVGHFLGIGHSDDPDAAMYRGYSPGSGLRRELGVDDVAAICAAFPPGDDPPESCQPRNGFAAECGADQPRVEVAPSENPSTASCSVGRSPRAPSAALLAVLGAAVVRRRARRR